MVEIDGPTRLGKNPRTDRPATTRVSPVWKLALAAVAGVVVSVGSARAATAPSPFGVGNAGSKSPPNGVRDGQATPQDLGNANKDLTYTPLVPCRVFDTRNTAIGAFTGSRDFHVTDAIDLRTQGATNAACGVPATDEPLAVVVNITAVSASSFGWTTVYPFSGPVPVASVLNWTSSGAIVPNTTVASICTGCGPDISIQQPSGAAYVFADVLGYFRRSEATALEIVPVINLASLGPGNVTPQTIVLTTSTCPAGFTLTGGGGVIADSSNNPVSTGTTGITSSYSFDMNVWRIAARSDSSLTTTVGVIGHCATVPGLLP